MAFHGELLLLVLELVLQLKDRLAQVLHLLRQLSYLTLILLLRVIAGIDCLNFLLLKLLNQLALLLVLRLRLLRQVLDLLHVEGLLLVVLGLAGLLHPRDVLLLLKAGIHPIC